MSFNWNLPPSKVKGISRRKVFKKEMKKYLLNSMDSFSLIILLADALLTKDLITTIFLQALYLLFCMYMYIEVRTSVVSVYFLPGRVSMSPLEASGPFFTAKEK